MSRFKFFSPILAGATLGERIWSSVGALAGICITGLVCFLAFGRDASLPLIVAPLGASAVLLFAVPASPLAQPWSIVGGNTISALVGVTVVHFVPNSFYAIGLAVSLAILAMSLTKSLHPPGGAAALTAVIGGSAVHDAGFLFPLVPVAVNSLALVFIGVVFHKLSRHNYPHKVAPSSVNIHKTTDIAPGLRVGFSDADIEAAIEDLHETLDIDRADLDTLLRKVEQRALLRTHGEVLCADIMSRDVIFIPVGTSAAVARAMLYEHRLRAMPVLADDGVLRGMVSYLELAACEGDALPIVPAVTAFSDDPAISLLAKMTDGVTHDVVIVERETFELRGIVSQTDLLAALGKRLLKSGDSGAKVAPGIPVTA